jgi:TatA/E family protein of Tat protein translocase
VFGISSWEFVIIALFVLIAFGPDRIPEIFKLLGKAAKMFREARNKVEEVTSQVVRPEDLETLKGLSDPLGTRELKNNVATLLDPLKNTIDAQKNMRAREASDASSIWSTLAAPAPVAEEKKDDADADQS